MLKVSFIEFQELIKKSLKTARQFLQVLTIFVGRLDVSYLKESAWVFAETTRNLRPCKLAVCFNRFPGVVKTKSVQLRLLPPLRCQFQSGAGRDFSPHTEK